MFLHRPPHSSRRFLVTITCTGITIFHQVEGLPALVEEATTNPTSRVILGLPHPPILPDSDTSWFDGAAVSALARRSSSDVVHDKVFIPTIVSMGVLVIICIYCCCHLILTRETIHTRNTPISSLQHAVGGQENGHGNLPLSRGLSKATRKSAPSTSPFIPGSPSAASNMLDQLQRRREEQHLRELQQKDLYQQHTFSNQGYPHPQQQYQYTPHPSVSGSAVPQPQLPHSVVPIAHSSPKNTDPSREQYWAQQNLQHPDLSRGIPHTPSAQTITDVLSYMTPPEDRQRSLPNDSSRPPNQDRFSPQHPAAAGSSTHGIIAHSAPANYRPASRLPSNEFGSRYPHQPPGYSATETRNGVQRNVTTSTTKESHSEKLRNQS